MKEIIRFACTGLGTEEIEALRHAAQVSGMEIVFINIDEVTPIEIRPYGLGGLLDEIKIRERVKPKLHGGKVINPNISRWKQLDR